MIHCLLLPEISTKFVDKTTLGSRLLVSVLLLLTLPSFAASTDKSAPSINKEIRIVFLGDSLTAGYGVSKDNAYPALVENILRKKHPTVKVVNAGVSGSTSASGVSNMKWQLKSNPNIVVLALGANDGLRGFKVTVTEENLDRAIALGLKNQVKVVLAGMKVPRNYGPQYIKEYDALFGRLAKKHNIPLIPFLLEGVGGVVEMNQPDGVHPNEKGHEVMAKLVAQHLEKIL
ncbi:MAG: arylesterase [Bdellovibrionales bacterium]|nr:arylesterase [Bdellovibrionales bacterium]